MEEGNNSDINIQEDEHHTGHVRLKLQVAELALPTFSHLPFREAAVRVSLQPGENHEEQRQGRTVQTRNQPKRNLQWGEQFCLDCCWEDELEIALIDDRNRQIATASLSLRRWHAKFNHPSFRNSALIQNTRSHSTSRRIPLPISPSASDFTKEPI